MYAKMWFQVVALFIASSASALAQDAPVVETVPESRVTFERQQFTVSRWHGRVTIDGHRSYRPLLEHETHLQLISYFDGVAFNSDRDFRRWAEKLIGTRTYTYDIVVEEQPDGTQTRQPLVLLDADKRAHLEAPWQQWLADQAMSEETPSFTYTPSSTSTTAALQSIADAGWSAANSLAVASGATKLWEVQLIKSNNAGVFAGVGGVGLDSSSAASDSEYVTAYGRDSRAAAASAVAQYPGYSIGTVRRLAGY